MEGNRKLYFIIFLVSLFFGSLFLLLIIVSYILFSFGGFRSRNESDLSNYQYSEINPFKNISRTGFVQLSKKLAGEEYISFFSEETGTLALISNFANEEFKCSGSCYCHKPVRRHANIISRSLFILISAVSSTVALKIAKESFHNSCQLHYSRTCSPENIISKVDNCAVSESPQEEEKEAILAEEGTNTNMKFETDRDDWRVYDCRGHCVRNRNLKVENALKAQEEFGPCKRLELTGRIKIQRETGQVKSNSNYIAKTNFRKNFLTPFCKRFSQKEYVYEFFDKKFNQKIRQSKIGKMCGSMSPTRSNISCLIHSAYFEDPGKVKPNLSWTTEL